MAAHVVAPPAVKKILFLTDFSKASEHALCAVALLARSFSGRVVLLHVLSRDSRPATTMEAPGLITDVERKTAERNLLRITNRPEFTSVACEVRLKRGDFWTAIEEEVSNSTIDMIVVGTHGRGALANLLLGSHTEEVLRRATCPVLSIGPNAISRASKNISRVLIATDFCASSTAALPYAALLAESADGQLGVVHDVGGAGVDCSQEQFEQLLQTTREALLTWLREVSLNRPPEIIVTSGSPGENIAAAAARFEADIIVMGAHTTEKLGQVTHFPVSIAHHVIAHAPCPVLTVRAPGASSQLRTLRRQ